MKPADALLATLRDFGGDEFAFRAMGAFSEYLHQEGQRALRAAHASPLGIEVAGPRSHAKVAALEVMRDDLVKAVERAP